MVLWEFERGSRQQPPSRGRGVVHFCLLFNAVHFLCPLGNKAFIKMILRLGKSVIEPATPFSDYLIEVRPLAAGRFSSS